MDWQKSQLDLNNLTQMWEKRHRRWRNRQTKERRGEMSTTFFTSSISFFPLTPIPSSKTNRFRPHFMDLLPPPPTTTTSPPYCTETATLIPNQGCEEFLVFLKTDCLCNRENDALSQPHKIVSGQTCNVDARRRRYRCRFTII